jgi:hypothetical protein
LSTNAVSIHSIDDWYKKWRLENSVNYEVAKQAIDELEALVESYCDIDLKQRRAKESINH